MKKNIFIWFTMCVFIHSAFAQTSGDKKEGLRKIEQNKTLRLDLSDLEALRSLRELDQIYIEVDDWDDINFDMEGFEMDMKDLQLDMEDFSLEMAEMAEDLAEMASEMALEDLEFEKLDINIERLMKRNLEEAYRDGELSRRDMEKAIKEGLKPLRQRPLE